MLSSQTSRKEGSDDLTNLLTTWLGLPTPREQRRFLEAQPRLLDPQSETILHEFITQAAEQPKEAQRLREAVFLLQDARQRGGTVEAIREAYVNIHGGWVLDLPSWLEEVEQRLAEIKQGGRVEQTAEARVTLLREVLARAQGDATLAPETVATLHLELAVALYDQRRGNRSAQGFEAALQACEEALCMYTLMRYPRQYAQVQHMRGQAFRERITGERCENVEQAITCFREALCMRTLEVFPYEYADTQNALGYAYCERIAGERHENVEQAIACYQEALRVRTLETFPYEHAVTQTVLGAAYEKRIVGERRENLERAIAFYQEALRMLTLEAFPYEYAMTQNALGITYFYRIAGERRENVEQAIECHQEALRVYTLEVFLYEYARTQFNLANAYFHRIVGERRENLEQAIACYQEALSVLTLEAFPYDYALAQNNLGESYKDRIAGERRENLERAIACYQEALSVWTLEAFPFNYALVQNNLGESYRVRILGERRENLEQAIAFSQETLRVWTLEAFPFNYALAQNNLGEAYKDRIAGERRENVERAIAFFHDALRVYTLASFPREYREVQLNLAETEGRHINWLAAHEAYTAALAAEDLLVALGAGTMGRDAILKEGRNAAIRDGYVLVRLGRIEEAARAMERGRARGLAEAMTFDAADSSHIGDVERRARYATARETLIATQSGLNAPVPSDLDEDGKRRLDLARSAAYREAKGAFDALVAEIRAAIDPADFLHGSLDAAAILQAAERVGAGHALVYLAATTWGGIAVAAVSANPALQTSSRFAALDLPNLTESVVNGLLETWLEKHSERIIGGFACMQTGSAFDLLALWPGGTVREKASVLHDACEGQQIATLDEAAQALLASTRPKLTTLMDQPIDLLSEEEKMRMATTLNHKVLQCELPRCLNQLAEVAVNPLVAWLQEQGTTSLTLIPCGLLAAFPLSSVPLVDGRTVAETLPTSMAPNARVLLREATSLTERTGVYALGDPHPTHQRLDWSEAEAFALAALSETLGHPRGVKVQQEATREWLIAALRMGRVVDASCHGTFNAKDVLRSALLLAKEERLTLGDMLSYTADLRGLRLLMLSACQTALLDLRGARDEVRSLAMGMLQAGALAVLAAHWAVDDKATYLLMVRFAQEWLPRMDWEPPAAALARAQQWLRNVTNRELETWEAMVLPAEVDGRREEQEGTTEEVEPMAIRGGLVAVRGRGMRYDLEMAQERLRDQASQGSMDDAEARPYADPYYWAGFQVMGW